MKNYKILMFLVAPFFLVSNDIEEVIVTANKKN